MNKFIIVFFSFWLFMACSNNKLLPGEKLNADDCLVSNNRKYKLVLQKDGNLVLYGNSYTPLWNSGTINSSIQECSMSNDGNLVIKDETKIIWSTNLTGKDSACLVLQDDSKLVIAKNEEVILVLNP